MITPFFAAAASPAAYVTGVLSNYEREYPHHKRCKKSRRREFCKTTRKIHTGNNNNYKNNKPNGQGTWTCNHNDNQSIQGPFPTYIGSKSPRNSTHESCNKYNNRGIRSSKSIHHFLCR
mmetsp:Transcript_49242/g.50011  ORF Transcript_49242/g.50011 Transcript_49242/m.50011 type:complete len:119 (-) Transcript_49242:926-1282(-)